MTDLSASADWVPQRLGEIWVKRGGDETAVYDPDSGRLYSLNSPALAIWEACDGETSASELAEALAELTGRPRNVTSLEVRSALEELSKIGLVTDTD